MTNAPAPTPPRLAQPPRRFTAGAATNALSLILATLLLAGTVALGIWLIESAPKAPRTPTAPSVSSQATREAYGGDAYTGIQNAAADTEMSVVAGTNTVTELASELQESQLEAEAAWWGHLWIGLAALIISIGAGNFVTALQRFGAQRQLAVAQRQPSRGIPEAETPSTSEGPAPIE